jgi:dihydroxyacetone kinase
MGVGLSAATVPAAGSPSFTLGEREIELGLGIHGEPGVRRGPLEPADFLVNQLLEPILANADLHPGDRVALLVNNLGGTTTMELAIVARHALAVLEAGELIVERTYAGTFLSALEMAGVSLSILQLDDTRLAQLDAPTDAPAWPNAAARQRMGARYLPTPEVAPTASPQLPQTRLGQTLHKAILAATAALSDAAPRLTEMDRVVGDGDLGISLARGSQAVREAVPNYPLDDPAATLHALSLTLQKALGGSSGPLYAVFFLRAAGHLQGGAISAPKTWAEAFRAGCQGMSELGGAKLGDRTMLDALVPAANAFQSAIDAGQTLEDAFATAVQAAEAGAGATANMAPRRGRSSYIGDRALGYIDPGAEASVIWLRALLPLFPAVR